VSYQNDGAPPSGGGDDDDVLQYEVIDLIKDLKEFISAVTEGM